MKLYRVRRVSNRFGVQHWVASPAPGLNNLLYPPIIGGSLVDVADRARRKIKLAEEKAAKDESNRGRARERLSALTGEAARRPNPIDRMVRETPWLDQDSDAGPDRDQPRFYPPN